MLFRLVMIFLALAGLYAAFEISRFSWMDYRLYHPKAEFQTREAATSPEKLIFVEFIDYNCRFCKEMHGAVKNFLDIRPDITYIARPIVVLPDGPSEKLARMALAAGIQGKFWEFHDAFLGYPKDQTIDDAFIRETAMLYGVDYDRLVTDSQSETVNKWMANNAETAAREGVQSTPTLYVGKTIIRQMGKVLTTADFQRIADGLPVDGVSP